MNEFSSLQQNNQGDVVLMRVLTAFLGNKMLFSLTYLAVTGLRVSNCFFKLDFPSKCMPEHH